MTVLWVIWLTYGSFYFCRQNISAAVPGLKNDGLSVVEIGWILGSLKVAYAIGQLVNGQIAEQVSARKLLAVGMIGSALLNFAFGFTEGLYFLIFIWACNGYCQSLGWTPCIRVAANWIPIERRGRVLGIIGTSYQFMASATYVIAGACVDAFGWRSAFYLPAALLLLSAFHTLILLRESPDSKSAKRAAAKKSTSSIRENIRLTLTNPGLWVLAMTLFLMDGCRYFFQDWGLTHLNDVEKTSVGRSAVKYAILPAGGIAGTLFAGWCTDRIFAGRRAPVIFGNLVLLGLLTFFYHEFTLQASWMVVALLFWIGFAIFGSQVLLVGTAPTDLARNGTAAAAAGFVNFMGYMGAFAGDTITGHLKNHYNWETVISFWAWVALAAALVICLLWRVGPLGKKED